MARVADPASLKAELRIAETQIKDVRLGQQVEVDTRNGIIEARVSRIDPAAREGTFTVDAELTGPLPAERASRFECRRHNRAGTTGQRLARGTARLWPGTANCRHV